MWKYVKKLEYPVNIQKKDLKMAKYLLAQYGGPYFNRDKIKKCMNIQYSYCEDIYQRKTLIHHRKEEIL